MYSVSCLLRLFQAGTIAQPFLVFRELDVFQDDRPVLFVRCRPLDLSLSDMSLSLDSGGRNIVEEMCHVHLSASSQKAQDTCHSVTDDGESQNPGLIASPCQSPRPQLSGPQFPFL